MHQLADQYAATAIALCAAGSEFDQGAAHLRAGRYVEAEAAIQSGLDRLARTLEALPRIEEPEQADRLTDVVQSGA